MASPHRGQELREEGRSFHAAARRLRVFDLEVFFFGTAIVNLKKLARRGPAKQANITRFGANDRSQCAALRLGVKCVRTTDTDKRGYPKTNRPPTATSPTAVELDGGNFFIRPQT